MHIHPLRPHSALLPLASLVLTCAAAAQDGGGGGALDEPLDLRFPAVRGDGRFGGEGRREPFELGPELPAPKGDAPGGAVALDPRALGFAAGAWAPPPSERVDPDFARAWSARTSDGRPRDELYGFAVLDRRISSALRAELGALGLRVLGYHPNNALRVAVPREALAEALAHPAIAWIGFSRPWQKLHPRLMQRLSSAGASEPIELYVSLFDSDWGADSTAVPVGRVGDWDPGRGETLREPAASPARQRMSNGWQQRALERVGVEILSYVPNIRAFRARAPAALVQDLVWHDFVQFVETAEPFETHHDRSMPMISADVGRAQFDGATSGAAVVGMIDTGMYISHTALQSHYSVSFDHTDTGVWTDACGHGTFVCGTILADPPSPNQAMRGAAPELGFSPSKRFRSVKIGTSTGCNGGEDADYFWFEDDLCDEYTDPSDNTSPRPHVVNMSVGVGGGGGTWVGSEAVPRFLDDVVYCHSQLWVASAGNSGPMASTLTQDASAKNVFAVGGVQTDAAPGIVASLSSRGPCGDARFKPNVCAPFSGIVSVQAGTSSGFATASGTSAAAPHVTGVAAQLVDHYSAFRYHPASLAGLLMATATSGNSAAIGTDSAGHLNSLGTGRIDAGLAHFVDSESSWGSWETTLDEAVLWTGDFTIGEGTKRLVAVMHYIEPSSSSGASQALVSDWDLVLDAPPTLSTTSFGDFDEDSGVSNTEIVTIDDPLPGTWRWKVKPHTINDEAVVSVTIHTIAGDVHPDIGLALSTPDRYVKPNEVAKLTADVSSPSFVASAVQVGVTDTDDVLAAVTVLADGAVAKHTDNLSGGTSVILGNIAHDESRAVGWDLSWADEGWKLCTVTADGDNTTPEIWSQDFVVDGTPPEPISGLGSVPPPSVQWRTDPNVLFSWSPTTDALSGVADTWWALGAQKPIPSPGKPLGLATSFAAALSSSASQQYFHLWAVDRCDNWTDPASLGPFWVDAVKPGKASNLVSTSHLIGPWSTDATVDFTWTAVADAHSGLNGYSSHLATSPTLPGPTFAFGAVTSRTFAFPSSADGRYLCLRAIDKAGNWSDEYAVAGPYKIDALAPASVLLSVPPTTSSLSVLLKIKATDLESGITHMRASNNGSTFSPWVAYATSTTWSLSNYGGSTLPGTKTVTLQARDAAGNVGSTTAQTIYQP